MSYSSHRVALAAFEENHDPLVAGLQSKITSFQKKQKKKAKKETDYYGWIQAQRNLNEAEAAISKQIFQASSNVLELMQKETDHAEVDPNSRANAIKSIQADMAVLQKPAYQENDIMALVAEVKRAIDIQTTTEGEERERDARCAKLLLDLRESLATSLDELDESYSNISKEAIKHKREVMLHLSEGQNDTNQLPQSLLSALNSLRTLLQESHHGVEDGGEIDMLENYLRIDFEDAKSVFSQISFQSKSESPCWDEKSQIIFKKALSSSNRSSGSNKLLLERLKKFLPEKSEQEIIEHIKHRETKKSSKQRAGAAAQDYKVKCQLIENNGLKEVERLREEINARSKSIKASIENDLKRKEMQLRLKAMRLEREEVQKRDAENQVQAIAKKNGDEYEKEINRTQRILTTKQALMKHQTQQMKDQEESCINILRDDFAVEIQSLKQQHANMDRTNYREEQIKNKLMAQQKAESEAMRAEEVRLERLNTLAATVPYYQSIMDKESDIHKSTEARKNDVYGGRSDLADFQSGKMRSFTEAKLFSDSKFRLGNALREAGVAHSTYARDVVRNAIPRADAPYHTN